MSGGPRKQLVGATEISATSYDEVTACCGRWIEEERSGAGGGHSGRYVTVTSAHGVVLAASDPVVRDDINGAAIATPDGMPVVWALRSFGWRRQQRVYGPTLMLRLCQQAEQRRHRLFLYGASPETLKLLVERLRARFPDLILAGHYSPPFRPLDAEEDRQVVDLIRGAGTELLLVGLSTPKQERWMASHAGRLPGVVMVGVGAAFDFHAGRVRQAPPLLQRLGLEWLFRLCMEPGRLWRRYLCVTPRFLPIWGRQKLGLARVPAAGGAARRSRQERAA